MIPSAKIEISGEQLIRERDTQFSPYVEFEVSWDLHMEQSHRQLDGYVILDVTREV